MARLKIEITGFDEILKKIEEAGGSIKGAVSTCAQESAKTLQNELNIQQQKKKVSSSLISRMPNYEIEWSGNRCYAKVGYKMGKYDPKHLSDGFKAVFINYGTPRIKPRKFIKAAKSKAKQKIKKQQQDTFEKILGGLKG